MKKLLWAGMAGFLCGFKYREMGRSRHWKQIRREALKKIRQW